MGRIRGREGRRRRVGRGASMGPERGRQDFVKVKVGVAKNGGRKEESETQSGGAGASILLSPIPEALRFQFPLPLPGGPEASVPFLPSTGGRRCFGPLSPFRGRGQGEGGGAIRFHMPPNDLQDGRRLQQHLVVPKP